MTTRIKITNDGPEYAEVRYYNQGRTFKSHNDLLAPGQSIEMDVWDGHLPVVMPSRPPSTKPIYDGDKLYSVPTATMDG